jgi:DNA-directed RNA polymerase specialized sigma24 family protein
MDPQDEIVRLLLMQLRGTRLESQADAIRELGDAGFAPARIAELVGTSRGTVDVTLARAKHSKRHGGGGGKTKERKGGRNG